MDSRSNARPPRVEGGSLRRLFASLVAEALGDTGVCPSPVATAYLVDLVETRLRAPGGGETEPATLAEAWLEARQATGSHRLGGLRRLGDRALFVSGFFGASLGRSVVGGGYYRDMGRSAYGALASALGPGHAESTWPRLFEELADRFPELVEVLAEVSDRAHGTRPEWLLTLYDRYLATGSPRDFARLIRAGCAPPRRGQVQ